MRERVSECIRDPLAKKDGLGKPRPPTAICPTGYCFFVVSVGLTEVLSQAPAAALSLGAAAGLGA